MPKITPCSPFNENLISVGRLKKRARQVETAGERGSDTAGTEHEKAMSIPAENFVQTLAANVNNPNLSDEGFRKFVRNALPDVSRDSHAKLRLLCKELSERWREIQGVSLDGPVRASVCKIEHAIQSE